MKINTQFAAKLIATVVFIAGTRCDCGGGGKSSSDTSYTVTESKPEEIFSQSERESLKKSISNMDAASAIAKFKEIFVMYVKKLAKEFPNFESDEKILKEVLKKRIMPYWSELKTIAKEGIKDPATLSTVLNAADNAERQIKSQGLAF